LRMPATQSGVRGLMSKSYKSLKNLAFAGMLLAGLTGCAGAVTTAEGDRVRLRSAAFAAWAEDVFRLQNEALDLLAFALDERSDDAPLLEAEDRVLDACAGLNAVAVRRQRGAGTRPFQDLSAARAVPDCEAAARSAIELLEQHKLPAAR